MILIIPLITLLGYILRKINRLTEKKINLIIIISSIVICEAYIIFRINSPSMISILIGLGLTLIQGIFIGIYCIYINLFLDNKDKAREMFGR